MIGLELAGQASRLFPSGDGTDAYPKARAPGTIIAVNVDGEAARAEFTGQLSGDAPFAERPDLDGKAILKAGTISGREILGLPDNAILEGNQADFIAVKRRNYIYDSVLAITSRTQPPDIFWWDNYVSEYTSTN